MMTFAEIERLAQLHGLAIVGAFHPVPEDLLPEGTATLILLGPDGPEMWEAFQAAPEVKDGAPNPMDRWSRRVITEIAKDLSGTAYFPFAGPPYSPFQRWATSGEGASPSPVSMQASARRGLWASYRGAVGLPQKLALPTRSIQSPCLGCSAPCQTACPVAAFAGGNYDVPTCTRHVLSGSGAECLDGCLVRRACPAGARINLPTAQRQFHMAAFLAANG